MTAAADDARAAIDEQCAMMLTTIDAYPSARDALRAVIDWHVRIALDPAVSSDAQALVERGAAEMRGGTGG